MIMAPVWTIMRNPYAEYAMPAAIIVLVVMFVIILFYNKIRLGVWLPGRKKEVVRVAARPLPLIARESRAGDVPNLIHAVPGRVTGFLVLGPGIKRFALIGPLFAAIVAADERKAS